MSEIKKTEVWQRGPVDNIPVLLQPVAHALLQAREEIHDLVKGFSGDSLWIKPGGVASVGFHLQHMTGVIDRLFTYAKASSLTNDQLAALSREGEPAPITAQHLVELFDQQVDQALAQLVNTDEQSLTETRGVGRAQIPSTVLGLLFHAAEHTMRHVGQLHVTVKIIKSSLCT